MRLFVAVEIDDALKDKIVGLQTKVLEPAVKLVERQNLHITLVFLGNVPDEQVLKIQTALREVKMAPFDVEIGGVGTFPSSGRRINAVWVDCKGPLAELAAKIDEALKPLGFTRDKTFVSHLTIGRVKRRPERLHAVVEGLKAIPIGRQRIDRFVLKRSTLTPKGPVYEDVEIYKLG